MADHAPRYPSYDPDVEPYEEKLTSNPVAPFQAVARSNYAERSVPLFLSDRDGVPDPNEYLPASSKKVKLGSYYTSRVLAGAVGGAVLAILAALVSSDSARDVIASAKASSAAALSVASVVMQSNSTQRKLPDAQVQVKEPVQTPAPDNQTAAAAAGTVTVAAVTPTRDDIKTAYQSALQGGTPQAAPAPEVAAPVEVIHHLDASEITSLLKRADSLIASGDVAASRLVLRRAAEAGDARAAMMLAGTYDPAVLGKLSVHGVVPDLAMARSWYEKARRFGAPEASVQLERLANGQH
jgi:TPR repeat protein